jgi:hypothetical protein
MGKLIVFSILFATMAIPLFFARDARPKRGLRKALVAFSVYCVAWVLATAFLAPRL